MSPEAVLIPRLFQRNTHFTLNTHLEESQKGLDIAYPEFLAEIQKKHSEMTHENLIQKVQNVVADLFFGISQQVSKLKQEQFGCGVYGLDFMVDEGGQAKLLEVTVAPDCQRAQRDYPNFWNEMFGVLLYGEQSENLFRVF